MASFFNNPSLKKFIEKIDLPSESKKVLLEKLPQMNQKERVALFRTLTEIQLFDLRTQEILEKTKKFWEK